LRRVILFISTLTIIFITTVNLSFASDETRNDVDKSLEGTIIITMTIKSIDLPGRTVILKDVGDVLLQLAVPAEIGNLEEIKVGDKVKINVTSTRVNLPAGAFTYKYSLNSFQKVC